MRVSLSLASVAGGGDWDWDLGYSLHIAVASFLPSSVLGAVVRAAHLCKFVSFKARSKVKSAGSRQQNKKIAMKNFKKSKLPIFL